MEDLILDDASSSSSSWADALQKVAPAVVSMYQQKQLADINLERAKQGLAPLDQSSIAPAVQVGVTSDTQRFLLIALGLVVGLAALKTLNR